ncbi:coadhesin-like [Ruditapes philippinarum]|uniref:coadhesin-like n=1 Tax=Ruditapes philippinarum TaxID=129788 RepID=UPI00295ABDA1|nr:coadhesin-like [Ruditapes philippinarum]
MGCADNQRCGGSASIGIVGRDMTFRQTSSCLECCSFDSCNLDLCKHIKPSVCIDDKTVDCARMSTIFHICTDVQHAKLVCPKFCGLCEVDGKWSDWSSWTNCDVTCDLGIQTKTRTCTNPAPANGGLDCIGNVTETKQCQNDPCPVHGNWSSWGSWASCSVSCDVGMQHRDRSCSNPFPSLYGDHCFGDSHEDRLCFPGACADGGWSSWENWGSCSESCGGGIQSRLRTCSNPRPSLLGRYCDGSPDEMKTCNKHICADLHVAFTAYKLNTSSPDHTTLKFESVYNNNGRGYDVSTGKFTCTIPGLYHFSITLLKPYIKLPYIESNLRINGSDKLKMRWQPSQSNDEYQYESITISQSGTFPLKKSDIVEVNGVSTHYVGHEFSIFTGFLVQPD